MYHGSTGAGSAKGTSSTAAAVGYIAGHLELFHNLFPSPSGDELQRKRERERLAAGADKSARVHKRTGNLLATSKATQARASLTQALTVPPSTAAATAQLDPSPGAHQSTQQAASQPASQTTLQSAAPFSACAAACATTVVAATKVAALAEHSAPQKPCLSPQCELSVPLHDD